MEAIHMVNAVDLEDEFAALRARRAYIEQRLTTAVGLVCARQAGRRTLPRPAPCMYILTQEEVAIAMRAADFNMDEVIL